MRNIFIRIGLLVSLLALMGLSAFARSGIIRTTAGPVSPVAGSLATTQAIDYPTSVAQDGAGGFFVASKTQNRVYRVAADGKLSLVAGTGLSGYSGDGGPATSAQLYYPFGVATDTAGNLYIVDTFNHCIRKVTSGGVITTVAGNGTAGYSGDGGPAVSAQLDYPSGVAIDAAGNLYIADSNNSRIRKVSSGGAISTVAGNGTAGYGGDGGPATSAQLNSPWGVALDTTGNLYIADYLNNVIRKVTTGGVISTVAGNGTRGFSGDGGPATSAQMRNPRGVALDTTGNLYIADTYDHRIRKVTSGGVISTIAGNGAEGYSGDGGLATSAKLFYPSGVSVDTTGNLYIADYANERTRKVTSLGVISTVAGNGTYGFSGDGGPATSAQLNYPSGVAIDAAGNLYIADSDNNRIRKVTPGGVISTVAGNGTYGFGGDGAPATSAQLAFPSGAAVDAAGNLYIADSDNNRIRKVTPGGIISTVAGDGTSSYGGDGGPATSAQLYFPLGVAVDTAGNLYIADYYNSCIRKVTPGGVISTVAGNGTAGYGGDGGPATSAQLYFPSGVALDTAGNLYIADYENQRIRKVTPGGVISTVAGNGTTGFGGDGGPATSAQLYGPSAIALDTAGNLYIADYLNNRIRKVSSGGVISTIAGTGTAGFGGDGGPANSAQLYSPLGVAVDTSGSLYIADADNHRIRKVRMSRLAWDTDADSESDIAVWRPSSGVWFVLPSGSPGSFTATQWGNSTDIAVPGDYDGDGKTDIAVWRPSSGVWYVLLSGSPGNYTATQWGTSGDIPVPGDYDGDGKTDIAVWRPSAGVWYVTLSGSPGNFTATQWGTSGDIPVAGDYDGDGKTDLAVWRPSAGVWYVLRSGSPGNFTATQWGNSTDVPVLGDYDGDGKTDLVVWRPSAGVWYIMLSGSPGSYTATQWGISTDLTIPRLPGIF